MSIQDKKNENQITNEYLKVPYYEGITKNQNAIMSTIKRAKKMVFILSSTCEFISFPPSLKKIKSCYHLNTFFVATSTQTYVTTKQKHEFKPIYDFFSISIHFFRFSYQEPFQAVSCL